MNPLPPLFSRVQVTRGERHTMAMWFTRSQPHAEDGQLLRSLTALQADSFVVRPPPSTMFHADGADLRVLRLEELGLCVQVQATSEQHPGTFGIS